MQLQPASNPDFVCLQPCRDVRADTYPTRRYRTQLCNDGQRCTRNVCFFAHNLEELRMPSAKPFVSTPVAPLPTPLQQHAHLQQARCSQALVVGQLQTGGSLCVKARAWPSAACAGLGLLLKSYKAPQGCSEPGVAQTCVLQDGSAALAAAAGRSLEPQEPQLNRLN